MRIVVTGASGRLGAVLCAELISAGHDLVAPDHTELDITRADQVTAVIDQLRPGALINCAAYNAVDVAEADPSAAFALNAQGPDTAGCGRRGDRCSVRALQFRLCVRWRD